MRRSLNLINKENSDIKYHIDHYPDGQIQLVLEDLDDNKFHLVILTRICNSDDLFILMQLSDIVNRRGLSCTLYVTYLLAARTDRLFSWNTSFTLKIVMDVLRSFNSEIMIFDPHSDVVNRLSGNKVYEINFVNMLINYTDIFDDSDNIVIVAPDEGAKDRLEHIVASSIFRNPIIYCSKTRDESGKVTEVKVKSESPIQVNKKTRLIVIDDLCDGGGTFMAIAPELKRYEVKEIDLLITHSIQLDGLKKVSSVYDKVITSNSYKDWNSMSDIPDNVEIIDVVNMIEDEIRC